MRTQTNPSQGVKKTSKTTLPLRRKQKREFRNTHARYYYTLFFLKRYRVPSRCNKPRNGIVTCICPMYDCEHFLPFPDRVGGWKNQRRINFSRLQARGNIGYNGHTCSKTHFNACKVLRARFCISSIQCLSYNATPILRMRAF